MNPEGLLVENMQKTNNYDIPLTPEIKAEFKERLFGMVKYYRESSTFKEIAPTPKTAAVPHDKDLNTVGWLTQFKLIVNRGLINEFRNPLEVKTRFWSVVIMSFICVLVFNGVLIKLEYYHLNSNVSWENINEGYKIEMGLCFSLLWDAHFLRLWIALWAVSFDFKF